MRRCDKKDCLNPANSSDLQKTLAEWAASLQGWDVIQTDYRQTRMFSQVVPQVLRSVILQLETCI